MGVGFQQFGGGGGASFVTQFSASYAQNANIDPAKFLIMRGLANGGSASSDFYGIDIVNNNAMRFTRSGGTGGNPLFTYVLPIPLINPGVQGKDQFAQATLLAMPVGAANCALCVLLEGDPQLDGGITNGMSGYAFVPDGGTGKLFLQRPTNTDGNLVATGVTWALNDVLRIEVRGPSTNWRITLKQNGVVIGTFSDNDSVRPVSGTGFPGVYVRTLVNNGDAVQWGAQSWGILTS
jgi:hypothetical protein